MSDRYLNPTAVQAIYEEEVIRERARADVQRKRELENQRAKEKEEIMEFFARIIFIIGDVLILYILLFW